MGSIRLSLSDPSKETPSVRAHLDALGEKVSEAYDEAVRDLLTNGIVVFKDGTRLKAFETERVIGLYGSPRGVTPAERIAEKVRGPSGTPCAGGGS